jgi:formaldehyde-activating enzyme involved in methanogenesis
MTVSLTALIGTHSAAYNDNDADKYFGPYQAACESRQPRLMEIALDGLHNLIGNAYALHLTNNAHNHYPLVVTICRAWVPSRQKEDHVSYCIGFE